MKRFLKVGLFCLIIFFIVFLLAEIILRLAFGIRPDFATPTLNSLQSDTIMGWANKPNLNISSRIEDTHVHSINTSTDMSGNRITSHPGSLMHTERTESIHLYGCSYTFGVAVDDTSTFAYKLQSLLPQYKVVNKGVSAYGLYQMYASLQHSVATGDTPRIAVFSYSNFHDMRSGFSMQWTNMLWWGVHLSENPKSYENNFFSYFDLRDGRLVTRHIRFSDLSRSWPMADKSSVIFLLNTMYINSHDDKLNPFLHNISCKALLEITAYCRSHNIVPVIGYFRFDHPDMVAVPHDMGDSMSLHGIYTVDYGIDVADKKWNCYPDDGGHPNASAHTVFATKLYDCLSGKKLIKAQAIKP